MYLPLLVLFLLFDALHAAKTFSLDLKREKKNGKQSVAKKMGKFGRLMSKIGGHPVFTDNNEDYFADITVGQDLRRLQTFRVVIDTGSAGVWIPNKGCVSYSNYRDNCHGPDGSPPHFKFPVTYDKDIERKRTQSGFRSIYSFSYAGLQYAQAAGRFVEEHIWFGRPPYARYVGELKLGLANQIHMPDDHGIIGLAARDDPDDDEVGTHFLHLFSEEIHAQMNKIFVIFYQRSIYGSGGKITFGDYDTVNCVNQVPSIVRVTSGATGWQFKVDSVEVNGVALLAHGFQALSDSGSTDLHLPHNDFLTIMHQIGPYTMGRDDLPYVDCNLARHTRIRLRINQMPYSIPVDDLIDDAGDGTCALRITATSGNKWLLGAPFVTAYCQIHHFGSPKKIGFARVRHHESNGNYF